MEPLDPYSSPQADLQSDPKPLGSLAQSARGKEIKQARVILVLIGLLTLAGNAFFLFNTPREVEQVIRQANIEPEEVGQVRQTVTIFCYTVYGGLALMGVLFLVFAMIIKSYPVPITIISLVLYILATIGIGYLNPASIASGIFLKVIIVVGLFRAVKAARAYERDTELAAATGLAFG